MRLLFRQRFTFGFEKFDIFNVTGETVFTVKARFSFGKRLEIYDRGGNLVGTLVGKVFTFLPTFEMYIGDRFAGVIQKKFTFMRAQFIVDCNGWSVDGNFWEYDYRITDRTGRPVATIQREFTFMDTYSLDVYEDTDALAVLMIVIAIDAEKDTRNY